MSERRQRKIKEREKKVEKRIRNSNKERKEDKMMKEVKKERKRKIDGGGESKLKRS